MSASDALNNSSRNSTSPSPYLESASSTLYSYFEDAFHNTPPHPPLPQSTSFLDNILNPVTNTRPPFPFSARPYPSLLNRPTSTRPSNPGRLAASPLTSYFDFSSSNSPMPPSQSGQHRTVSSSSSSGFVDLTSESDPPQRRQRRTSGESGPSAKRQKRNDGSPSASRRGSGSEDKKSKAVNIEEIDLSEATPLRDVLEKQRAEAIKAQQRPEEKATTLNNFTCVICMETPTDMTATSCGHLFCHTCLMEALIAGENRSAPGEPRRSQCPVCRKLINRFKNPQTDIIPLEIMKKGLATQPRRKASASQA